MQFKKIKGFGKYEISESGTTIRNVKTKAIVSLDKGVSIRLMNDEDERITINKKDFAEKLIGEGEFVEVDVTGVTDESDKVVEAINEVTEETKLITKQKQKQMAKTKKKAPAKKTVQKKKQIKNTVKKIVVKKLKKEKVKSEKKERTGVCSEIRKLFSEGKTRAEIIAKGYHKHTVYVQTGPGKNK